MKKVLLLTIALLLISASCFAKVTEWVDPTYNFNDAKRIYIKLNIPEYFIDGSQDMEMEQAFFPQIKETLKNKLPKSYVVDSIFTVAEKIKAETGVDVEALYQQSPTEANNAFFQYVRNNYDLGMYVTMIAYDRGYEYREGVTINVPVTSSSSSTITDAWNPMNQWHVNTTTTTREKRKVGNGLFPAVYVTARMDIYKMTDGKPVWARVDRRERLIKPLNQTTNKSMLSRMSGDFGDMLYKKLTTVDGKPTGKSVSSNRAGF